MSESQRQPDIQPTSPTERRRPVRRKTASQRQRDRMRIIYIIVAVTLVLFLLSGLFATAVPMS